MSKVLLFATNHRRTRKTLQSHRQSRSEGRERRMNQKRRNTSTLFIVRPSLGLWPCNVLIGCAREAGESCIDDASHMYFDNRSRIDC